MENINNILEESSKLIADLNDQLNDTKEVIEAIKKGNIDAILLVNKKMPKLLVLTTSDQSYRTFIQDMSEGVVTLYSDGMILYANTSFARIVGLPLEKISGSIFQNFISSGDVEKFETLLKDFPGGKNKLELLILNKEETTKYFIVSINRIIIKELVTFNLVLTDVTDLKKKEESLMTTIEDLNLIIDKQKSSNEELMNLNIRLTDYIKILEAANTKLQDVEK